MADEVEEALEWAVAHQIQSDDRFKLSLFKRRASTYGNRLILTELAQHGVCNLESLRLNHTQSNDNQIEDVIASEQDRAYDWIKRRQRSDLQALIEGGLATAQTQTQILILKSKIFKSLSARGFEFDHIDQAWRRIMSELKLNT